MAPLPSDAGTEGARGAHSAYPLLLAPTFFSPSGITAVPILDAVGSSRILIGKQKIGLTFNSDKLGGNDFTKFSKLTMCSA